MFNIKTVSSLVQKKNLMHSSHTQLIPDFVNFSKNDHFFTDQNHGFGFHLCIQHQISIDRLFMS
jgi:hypothetical protein